MNWLPVKEILLKQRMLKISLSQLPHGPLLAESQPEIAALGNEIILNEIVDQISNANVVLEQLNENPDVAPTQFKALASATQNVLDNLGEVTSNTIFVEEVTLLNEASTESEVEVLALMDLSTTVMSLSDVDSPSNDTSSEGPNSVDSNDPPVNNEVLESFNLDVLNEFIVPK